MLPSFEDFYRHVTGHTPFAWQSRLAREVEAGSWPAYVGLPTAAGKTSLVEIWAYALAHEIVARGVQARRVPLRLVWVVDRRIIVDAVAERARMLADVLQACLGDAQHPLAEIAAALSGLRAPLPLTVAQLRGGMAGQRHWVDAPNQPVVLATTVDQAGSRLLFRGYGLSAHQMPMEAGLFACDTLVIVDEAHLSQPFVETLAQVRRRHEMAAETVAPALRVAVLSATLPEGVGMDGEARRFSLTAQERAELAARLARPKVAALLPVEGEQPCAQRMAEAARRLVDALGKGSVTAVIANRVDTAREIFARLASEHDAVLLTGRVRPYDRDILLARWLPWMLADRAREAERSPCVVVATQTVEVGADFDFDALVSEVAPLSALRQRFGRLNRLGVREQARAVIVQRGAADGVYPEAVVKRVWEWLTRHASSEGRGRPASIDLADEAVARLLAMGDAPPDIAPSEAPILTRVHAAQWAQTSPIPDLDPDVVPFLHGKEKPLPAEAQVVWRADVVEGDLARAGDDQAEARARIEQRLSAQLDLAPPRIEEALSLPVWTVRRWLARASDTGPLADVEAAESAEANGATAPAHGRYALRWDGRDATIILPTQIAPGDTVIVPASYGGSDAFGWHSEHRELVRDVGGLAGRQARRRQHLRLHPLVLPALLASGEDVGSWDAALELVLDELDTERNPDVEAARDAFSERLMDYVREILPHVANDARETLESWQASDGRWIPYPLDEAAPGTRPAGVVLEWVVRGSDPKVSGDGDAEADAADQSSMVGLGRARSARQVTLAAHSEAVGAQAGAWARACGLAERMVWTLEWAGRLHDLGKCEPRFQLMLHGGDEAAAATAREPLAKSGMDPHDRVLQEHARRLARLPIHMRHEAISARLLLSAYDRLPAETDRDLLCYLVGTHHGRGRPWFPIVEDPSPTEVRASLFGYTWTGKSATGLERVDGGWLDLFAMLQRRYGVWGLAYLEALLRLADHWVSAREAQEAGA